MRRVCKYLFCFLVFSHLVIASSFAQQPYLDNSGFTGRQFSTDFNCGNDLRLYELRKDPKFKNQEDQMNREILSAAGSLSDDTITLPVVVHIINSNPYAISDAYIANGIKDLNDAFSKSGAYSASAGADTKLRFCLAQKDPDGGNTTGITRTTSFFGDHMHVDIEDRRLKNLIQWDPSRYINIWLVVGTEGEAYADFICGSWYRLRIGGYATMPPGGGPTDGIVVSGFGTVMAHEMGHYLGLYHTFEGGCSNFDCTLSGDRVCDTPPDGSVRPSAGCGSPENSCNSDTLSNYSNGFFHTDVPDQIANFMDYGNTSCSKQFTQGQADRMRAMIQTQRSGLLQNECVKPCAENIIASFKRNIPYPVPEATINFTNTTSGSSNYQWLVNDVPVATTADFTYTFAAIGKYKVTLKAYNTDGCFASYSDFVIVNCGVTARFYSNKKALASKLNIYKDSIVFTNTSYNATSYQWLISNDKGMAQHVESTTANITYVFPDPATYIIRLIATNGSCSDTTEPYVVSVADPTADAVPFNATLYCYQQNKVRVSFCIVDYGYASIPANTPVSFYDADPKLPGANKLSPSFNLPYAVPGGNCYLCYNHTLDANYRGLEKIYIVVNDAGTAIPITLPNSTLVESSYNNNIALTQTVRTVINTSICEGQNYAGHTKAGTYIDTLTSIINGCDSIRTLNLAVRPVFKTTVDISICEGENYAGHTKTGTYTDLYSATNGCDSVRTLHLTVKPKTNTFYTISICEGQNYYGHTTAGTYIDKYFGSNGCDSIRTVYLTVKPITRTNISATICQGQNYAGHTTSGIYTDTYFGANGCDSIRTLQLTVKPVSITSVTASICQGENYAGHVTSGTYVDVYSGANGCDSTRTLYLTVNPLKFTTVDTAICEGENYAGHTLSGTYIDVYKTFLGCDSTRTLYLKVKPLSKSNIIAVICEGENYAGHTQTGVYIDVYPSANGCDSTRTLHLTVNPKKYTTFNPEICQGASYLAGGKMQTKSGTYYDTLKTYLGCDSILVTNLTVHPLPAPSLGADRGICIGNMLVLNPGNFVSYQWQDGSKVPSFVTNVIGTYWVSVTDSFGCRASDTMNLLKIYPLPSNFLPGDSMLCDGNTLTIKAPGYLNYSWNTGSNQNFIDVTKTGTYELQVTDKYFCQGIDSMLVLFYKCVPIQMPDAFTPNGDGKNEVYRPFIPAPLKNYHFQVWNRWGQKMFDTKEIGKGWDGTLGSKAQPSEVYVYVVDYTYGNGNAIQKRGSFVLIR
jgi:gliding motility-associated-like protein